jgi:RNA polymerase sigma-70 factor, ECF subfamily
VTTTSRPGQADLERLFARHRRELLVHCYRMLGGLEDAEDAVQDTMVKAWRRLDTFEGRSSVRAWLYRIATNVCLDALDRGARRILPTAIVDPADPSVPPAADDHETPWLQPIPDTMLDPTDADADPSTVVIAREHVELAFIAAIQHLPPRQRAVLLLRDVMGYNAAETARLLDTSLAAVNSALQRARALLDAGLPDTARHRPSGDSADLVRRYMAAWRATDVDALVALMRADALMAMPPTPSWYHGRDSIGTYLRQLFTTPFGRDLSLKPTTANRQPALAVYTSDGRPFAVKVFTVDGDAISAITGFVDLVVFTRFAP